MNEVKSKIVPPTVGVRDQTLVVQPATITPYKNDLIDIIKQQIQSGALVFPVRVSLMKAR